MSESQEPTGLAEAESPAGQDEESGWSIPQNLSIDKFDRIVVACHKAEADKRPVDSTRIATIAGIDARTTVPNLRFLEDIGVLSTANKGKSYSLTEKGTKYSESLSSNQVEEAAPVLRELLTSSHLKDLITYLEVQKGSKQLAYDSVFSKITSMARIIPNEQGQLSGRMSSGIRCLISLLERAQFVPSGFSQQATVKTTEPTARKLPKPLRAKHKEGVDENESGTSGEVRGNMRMASPPFNITINIEAKDAESIKQLRALIKELLGEADSEVSP